MEKIILTAEHPQWLAYAQQIDQQDWAAAHYLARQMRTQQFTDWEQVLILQQDQQLIGFCSLVKQDIIELTQYQPYIATVYVAPAFRGRHYSSDLVSFAETQLRQLGFSEAYIATEHHGLYEKMGYEKVNQGYDNQQRLLNLYHKNLTKSN